MIQLAIIADDLTGAADSAGFFASAGLSTAIPLVGTIPLDTDIISISTESRDLAPDDAATTVRAAIAGIRSQGLAPRLLYKKLDSALRGNLRAELLATMDALGEPCALVCPALPAEGRTTIGGRQHIGGMPLEESSFGGGGTNSNLITTFAGPDDVSPVVTAIDLDLLRSSPAALTAAIVNRREGIFIVDAETDDDLRRIAECAIAARVCLLAGSAGLARALVEAACLRSHATAPAWRPAEGRPILMIIGTRHQATKRQIDRAAAHGVRVVCTGQECVDNDDGELGDAATAVEDELSAGRHVILTSVGTRRSPLGTTAVADRLASIVDSAMVRDMTGGLVLTGGDVAAAVCRRIGACAIRLRGEVRPALPWGTLDGGAMPGVPVVTKAGSFGDDESLLAAAEHLFRASR